MIKIYILCILCILFFGCFEEKRQEFLEPQACEPDQQLKEDNAKQEDLILMLSNKVNELKLQKEKDLEAMESALNGFAECHIAVNCMNYPDYEYEFFACSELTVEEINFYADYCSFSNSYNEFYDYVLERGYEND